MGIVVDHHNRGEAAGTEAGHSLDGEGAVGRGFAGLDTEMGAHGFKDGFCAANVAGGALTDADDVLAAGGQVELGIEGDDAENFGNGDIEFGSDGFKNFLRQI